ncbi:hypothetical protein ABIB37_002611 [Agrococcus sp. UYP10]|uniref:hypothetical protein n=1 Tax=Agrococcus sp. UYP10 TaxID=1756355 RepID=UPI00339B558C
MSMIDQPTRFGTESFDELENPFAEREFEAEAEHQAADEGFTPWTEGFDPFAESFEGERDVSHGSEAQAGFGEAYAELRDEAFDEALEQLADETAEAIGGAGFAFEGADGMRSGEAYLAPIQAAGETYIDRLRESLEQLDLASLSEVQLAEQLDRVDAEAYRLTPAGEEFIGGIVRKAKRAASFVVSKAKAVGRTVIAPALRAVFSRLKTLIRPLLITGESEDEFEFEIESLDEGVVLTVPSLAVDPEQIAEGFDAALAEAAVLGAESEQPEAEYLDGSESEGGQYESVTDGRELEALAEARAALLDRLAAADESEDLAPAIEQFIPAVLAALRIGVRVVGRPKVVRFLAKYLANYIGKWTGPKLAGPLSVAIVDIGMRLATLEAGSEAASAGETESERDLSAALLMNTVEDTARRLAELEDFQLEDEDLLRLALSESFEEAVAANFPASVVREELQLAPSMQASFIPRGPRSRSPYRVLNRRPELSITPQLGGAIRTFGGLTLTASLKSRGIALPSRFRVHVVQVAVGGSLRTVASDLRKRFTTFRPSPGMFHPLTPGAAAALFREPRLGVRVAPQFLRSRRRIAAGQRFYILEPIGAGGALGGGRAGGLGKAAGSAAPATRGVPSQGWCVIDLRQAIVRVALHLTENDAQRIAADIRGGVAPAAALRALASVYEGVARSFANPDGRVRVVREAESEDEQFIGGALRAASQKVIGALARVLRSWVLPAIAGWLRTKSAEFARAAANPANGVTLVVTLRGVPGLRAIGDVLAGRNVIANTRAILNGSAFRGAPSIDMVVRPGLVRP